MKTWLVASAMVLVACGGTKKEKEKDKPAQSTTYTCKLEVGKKRGPAVTGQANSDKVEDARAAAWKDVCAKLPADDQASCKDDEKFEPTVAVGTITSNGTATYSVSIKLAPKTPSFEGEASSDKDEDTACQLAIEEACKKAGAQGDCVRSHEYERRRE